MFIVATYSCRPTWVPLLNFHYCTLLNFQGYLEASIHQISGLSSLNNLLYLPLIQYVLGNIYIYSLASRNFFECSWNFLLFRMSDEKKSTFVHFILKISSAYCCLPLIMYQYIIMCFIFMARSWKNVKITCS